MGEQLSINAHQKEILIAITGRFPTDILQLRQLIRNPLGFADHLGR